MKILLLVVGFLAACGSDPKATVTPVAVPTFHGDQANVAPTISLEELFGSELVAACSSSSDCGGNGKCSGGKCGSCSSSSDCNGNGKCSGGKCGSCSSSSDCSVGKCASGQCGSCSSSSDCKGGTCSGGKCSNYTN